MTWMKARSTLKQTCMFLQSQKSVASRPAGSHFSPCATESVSRNFVATNARRNLTGWPEQWGEHLWLHNMNLTLQNIHDTLPPIFLEVGDMKGSCKEYKPGRWRIRVWDNGERYEFVRTKHGDILEGQKQAHKAWAQITQEIEDKIFNPEDWGKQKPFILNNAFETFQSAKQCAEEWKYHRERDYKNHISPELGSMDMREIRAVHVNELHGKLIEKGLSPKSQKNVMALLSSIFHFHRIPDPGFPHIKVQDKEIKWLTSEEQEIVMAFLDAKDQAIFRFLQITGCRSGEACALMREDVDWKRGMVIVQRSMGHRRRIIPYTKTRRIKVIPIATFGEWTQILRPVEVTPFIFSRDGRPYWRQRLQRAWKTANKASGLPPILVKNAFRHSLASQEIQKGTPIEAISKMLGHSSIKVTQERYANLSPETAWKYRATVSPLKKEEEDL